MQTYGASTYGDHIADIYDDLVPPAEPAVIETLVELSGGGTALELGIGTGRIALPLRERSVEVHGIDASQPMVDRLRQKAGGEEIPVTIGDFADVPVEASFDLIFVASNTFFGLLTQEDQLRCFANIAGHLNEGGLFALEVFVPDLSRFDEGQTVRLTQAGDGLVDLEASRHDAQRQLVESHQVRLTSEGVRLFPVKLRYAWPSELDLMARLAGLTLRDRWGGWGKEPFTSQSQRHVSVYAQSPS